MQPHLAYWVINSKGKQIETNTESYHTDEDQVDETIEVKSKNLTAQGYRAKCRNGVHAAITSFHAVAQVRL